MERRIDAYLVCGGKYHDFDFARLELLKLLAEDDHVRVQVAQHYGDVDAIAAVDFLVTYTCDLRPTPERAGGHPGVGGARRALGGPARHELRPRPAGRPGRRPVRTAPRVFPRWADTLGSQFLSHPPIAPYVVERSPGAERRPAGRRHRVVRVATTSST